MSLITLPLCCCGCASVKACGECRPNSNASRCPYVTITAVASAFAILLQKAGHANIFGNWALCDMIEVNACSDNAGVQRILFALSLFFIIHAATIKCWGDFHKLFWLPKVFLTIAGTIALFFVDNAPFEAYSQFARYMAAIDNIVKNTQKRIAIINTVVFRVQSPSFGAKFTNEITKNIILIMYKNNEIHKIDLNFSSATHNSFQLTKKYNIRQNETKQKTKQTQPKSFAQG